MINYPVKSDVLPFLRYLVASLQPFAEAHSVLLTFESDRQTLQLNYHPETIAADLMQLLCRVVTFTPQNQSVKLSATLHDADDAFYVKLVVENTGVNISRVKEIAQKTHNRVIIHADRERSTAYEMHWYLEKPMETDPSVSDTILHPPDNIRNFYAAVRNRLSTHFQKQENQLTVLGAENTKDVVFLQKALTVIHAHIGDEAFDVEHLAQSMAMSRMQLHRRLKALVHLSPVHYIRDVRLTRAKEMIEKEDLTIGEICFQLGFQSQSYFTRAFVEKYGVRPTAYRHKK
jgi:AraC-like DNA-binding protein